jgi:hypothetical protein
VLDGVLACLRGCSISSWIGSHDLTFILASRIWSVWIFDSKPYKQLVSKYYLNLDLELDLFSVWVFIRIGEDFPSANLYPVLTTIKMRLSLVGFQWSA